MAGKDLGARLLMAAVGIPLAVLLIWLGGWWLAAMFGLVAALSANEYFRLAAARDGVEPLVGLGVLCAVGLVALAAWMPVARDLALWGFPLVLALVLTSMTVATFRRWPDAAPLASASATVSGVLYTGGTLAFGLLLRHLPEAGALQVAERWWGVLLLVFPIMVTWVGDSAAYFVGHRFGKRKLAPKLSPGKTVEGGLGGLLFATGIAVVFSEVALSRVPGYDLPIWVAAGMGAAIGVGAQVGDLAESVMKREAGVKDSGALLPGHGGALDRFDALFFTLPLTYALFALWHALR